MNTDFLLGLWLGLMPAALDRTGAFKILSAEIALRQLTEFFRIAWDDTSDFYREIFEMREVDMLGLVIWSGDF